MLKPLLHPGLAQLRIPHADNRPQEPSRIALHHFEHDLDHRVGFEEWTRPAPSRDPIRGGADQDYARTSSDRGDDAERNRVVTKRYGDDRMACSMTAAMSSASVVMS